MWQGRGMSHCNTQRQQHTQPDPWLPRARIPGPRTEQSRAPNALWGPNRDSRQPLEFFSHTSQNSVFVFIFSKSVMLPYSKGLCSFWNRCQDLLSLHCPHGSQRKTSRTSCWPQSPSGEGIDFGKHWFCLEQFSWISSLRTSGWKEIKKSPSNAIREHPGLTLHHQRQRNPILSSGATQAYGYQKPSCTGLYQTSKLLVVKGHIQQSKKE